MPLEDLVILLPCYSLEDLPLEWSPEDAASLLAAWSGLYHPALLAAVNRPVRWFRAEDPPPDPSNRVIAIPSCSTGRVPAAWLEQAEQAGACLLRDYPDRCTLVAQALDYLGADRSRLDGSLAEDFLALGFCHLQVELLTRQLRYMSNLDTDRFQRETLEAAQKAMLGETEAARDSLRSAFERLTEAREYYYPAEAHLLDLTLVAPSTAGAALRAELAGPTPVNLLLSGETLDQLAHQEPATLAALREALAQGRATIVGGETSEAEQPLLAREGILERLTQGLATYQAHLERRPAIFGRRRFGLCPTLPGLLAGLGFSGALHVTLDDGRFPVGKQSKFRWAGPEGRALDALGRVPIEAARADLFTKLPKQLGNTLDTDHAATVVFAHWPGHSSPWYGDLQRMSAYSPVLGRFLSLEEYFQKTESVGTVQKYAADEYRSPYLRQAVAAGQADPISRWVRYHRARAAIASLQTLGTLARCLGSRVPEATELAGLCQEIEALPSSPAVDESLPARLEQRLAEVARQAAACLTGAAGSGPSQSGYLLWNPRSSACRRPVNVSRLARPPAAGGAVWRSAELEGRKEALVDVPALGFAWVTAAAETPPAAKRSFWARKPKTPPPLAEPYVLRNEFLEAVVDPSSGAIKSLVVPNTRGNRLAQQLALRKSAAVRTRNAWGDDDLEQDYSVMAADHLSVEAGPLAGRIESRGRLLTRQGQQLARFVQRMLIRRGIPLLYLDIELEIDQAPEADPWDSYYAIRFAWGYTGAELVRGVHGTSQPTQAVLLEAPEFLAVRSGDRNTTILTGGLPYHRRFGTNKLDTLLAVRGEQARRFQVAVGVDLLYPMSAAQQFLAPEVVVPQEQPPGSPVGWLFHVDAKNVLATAWQPLVADGQVVGYRVRLLETEGRAVQAGLRSYRAVASAQRTQLNGESPTPLPVADDRVTIDLQPFEWIQVEARFASG